MSNLIKVINNMTSELINSGIAIDFTSTIETQLQDNKLITWNKKFKLSNYFRANNLYSQYKSFLNNKDYTILFKDGSLIQLSYEFDSRMRNLIKHRLYFLHFPFLNDEIDGQIGVLDYLESFETQNESFQAQEEIFEAPDINTHFQINKFKSMGFLRFDYDPRASETSETPHPKCHLTINKEGVRIPISKPIKPETFLKFILNHYYNYNFTNTYTSNMLCHNDELTPEERRLIHLIS